MLLLLQLLFCTSCINQTPAKLTFNNRKIRYQPKPTPRKTPNQPYKTKSKKPSKITYRQLSKHTPKQQPTIKKTHHSPMNNTELEITRAVNILRKTGLAST
jgi:hypothetical protein